MTKYIVKKEFVGLHGKLNKIGDAVDDRFLVYDYVEGLVGHGFIEPVKEDTRWIPKSGEDAYFIDLYDSIIGCELEVGETRVYNPNTADYNYFKSRETAEKVAEVLKLLFEYLHDPNAEDMTSMVHYAKSLTNMEWAINEARRAVLEDDRGQS